MGKLRARMRGALLLLPLLGCASPLPQGGFLYGIGNAFNNFFGGDSQGSRPPPRQAQRPPPRQAQRPRPQQQFQPQPQQQFQQQQFQPQPPRPQPAAPSFNPRPTAAPAAPPRLVGGTSLCGAAAPNHFWTDPRDNVQPDNRAAGENPPHPEVCLGILNNFYADGIKWHDVACHHKKPTVCEPRN